MLSSCGQCTHSSFSLPARRSVTSQHQHHTVLTLVQGVQHLFPLVQDWQADHPAHDSRGHRESDNVVFLHFISNYSPLEQDHLAIHPAHDSSDHRESDQVGPNKCQYSLIRHHPHYQQHFPLVQVQEQDPLQWHDNAVPEGRDHRRCSDLVCLRYLPANR